MLDFLKRLTKSYLNMKKTLLFSIILVVLVFPLVTDAVDVTPIKEKIESVSDVAWTIAGTLAVVMLIYAGILFVTATGEPEKLGKAKKAFIWGITGLILAILANTIVSMIVDNL